MKQKFSLQENEWKKKEEEYKLMVSAQQNLIFS